MNQLFFTDEEVKQVKSLVESISHQYSSAEDETFLKEVNVYAHELPRRLRSFLNEFELQEPYEGVCMISGYPIDNLKIEKTPSHWRVDQRKPATLEEEILLTLFGSLLGYLIGWSTQQGGRIVHDIIPIKAHEYEQLGSGSREMLAWHNEDAFHPFRGDYLVMLCLRNPDRVATNFAPAHISGLSQDQIRVLFEPRFTIRPDKSHLKKNRLRLAKRIASDEAIFEKAYEKIHQMDTAPEKIAVLFGDREAPYIRIDPYFMDLETLKNDRPAYSALMALIEAIDTNLEDVILQPGDLIFFDNFKAVHGRRSFQAHYNGEDRWLKRINLAKDLRKSRTARLSNESRVLF
jgi:Fe(II)/alpha-ketoglutarate-dependent arginine beta-hydroxylase